MQNLNYNCESGLHIQTINFGLSFCRNTVARGAAHTNLADYVADTAAAARAGDYDAKTALYQSAAHLRNYVSSKAARANTPATLHRLYAVSAAMYYILATLVIGQEGLDYQLAAMRAKYCLELATGFPGYSPLILADESITSPGLTGEQKANARLAALAREA